MFKCFPLASSSILLQKYENMLLSLAMMILINPLNTILKDVVLIIPDCLSSQRYIKTPKPFTESQNGDLLFDCAMRCQQKQELLTYSQTVLQN